MAKMPRENRVPIMMSEEELTAIDDWRFSRRIATRSDAVRRLCRIGLLWDQNAEPLRRELQETLDRFAEDTAEVTAALDEPPAEAPEWLSDYVIASLTLAQRVAEDLQTLGNRLRMVGAPAEMMKAEGKFDEVLQESKRLELIALVDALQAKVDKFKSEGDGQA